MRLRSFHGATLTEAMSAVRAALGDNAIIVATRDDEGGGVRVTAAIEEIARPAAAQQAQQQQAEASEAHGSAVIEIVAENLLRHQVPNVLAERLLATAVQSANDDPVLALAAAFDTHFKFVPLLDEKAPKPLTFIGTPGAGKTLNIAKYATKYTLDKKSLTLISTDTERAGGIEQLTAFTRLLKIDLMEIEDAHALKDTIGIQKPGQITLIDTPGRNPFAESESQHLRALITAAGGDAVLVLPSDLDAQQAIDLAQAFKILGASRVIATRLDMTRRLGSLLRTAFETKLPLAGFSASNNVTEAPQPLTPVALARLILPAQKTEHAAVPATGTHQR